MFWIPTEIWRWPPQSLCCSLCAFTDSSVYIQGRNNTHRAALCSSKPNSQSTN